MVQIKYPNLEKEGVLTTSMELFEKQVPNYVKNFENWGLDVYDDSDPAARVTLANRIFNLNKNRRSVNVISDAKKPGNQRKNGQSETRSCSNCGRKGHIRPECRLLPECYSCHKRGHLANECRSRPKPADQNPRRGGSNNSRGSGRGYSNNFQDSQQQNQRGQQSNRGNYRPRNNSSQQNRNCFSCGLPDHWAKNCPKNKRVNNFNMQGPEQNHEMTNTPYININ